MKNVSKKIFIYFLCAVLTVSTCSCSYMRSVYAFEYVGGALAFEEALKWLLGAIGIVSAGGMTADYWENHGREFEEYCAEQELTNQEVTEWQMKLCQGILDKSSACWSAFKSWAISLVGSGSEEPDYNLGDSATAKEVADIMCEIAGSGYRVSSSANLKDTTVYAGIYYYGINGTTVNGGAPQFYLATHSGTYNYSLNENSQGYFKMYRNGSVYSWSNAIGPTGYSYPNINLRYTSNNILYDDMSNYGLVLYNCSIDSINSAYLPGIITHIGTVGGEEVVDGDMVGLDNVNTENLDIINADTVDEEDQEVSIPMPGIGSSDDTISSDTYDNIVDGINDGTISLDDGITQIQELLRVIVYDDTTDDVIPFQPDPDTGENKNKDDVIQENKSNMGFTLFGLENVFPFCIPWDIFAFLSVLKADPVAPVFNLPFPNVNDPSHPLTVRVDLSDWDNAASIIRLAEDFLFIVGLAFLTRSMIGAGGDD